MANYGSLFEELAKAKAKPSQAYQDAIAGIGAVSNTLGAYTAEKDKQREETLKNAEVLDNFGKLVDAVGYNKASQIFPFEKLGIDRAKASSYAPTTPSVNPTDLGAQYSSGDIGKTGLDQGLKIQSAQTQLEQNRPRTVGEVRQTLLSGGINPAEANDWITKNTSPDGTISNRNFSDYIAVKGLANNNAKGGFYSGRITQAQLADLPSRSNPNTAAGAASQVQVAARQGKALIANATSPQNLTLASVDLARAVQRAAPQLETIGASNYAQSIPTLIGRLTQKINSDPNSPDVPKIRKQLYDTFDELEKSARPFIANQLQTMQDAGFAPPNFEQIKRRELGLDLPPIAFNENPGSASPVPSGMLRIKASDGTMHDIPQQNIAKAKQIDPNLEVVQ